MKKPDRFKREAYQLTTELYAQADNQSEKLSLGKIECACAIAIKLRKEHAWMRRMVNSHLASMITIRKDLHVEGNAAWMDGYRMACEEFLSQLTQRRK